MDRSLAGGPTGEGEVQGLPRASGSEARPLNLHSSPRLQSHCVPSTAAPPGRRAHTGDAGAPSRCSWCQVPFEECAWTFLCVPPAAAGSCLAALVWRVDLLAVHSFPFGGERNRNVDAGFAWPLRVQHAGPLLPCSVGLFIVAVGSDS